MFPLPLSPLEAMMLVEDRPGYPQVATIELDLAGAVERELLEQAWHATTTRHPLAAATVSRDGRRWQWERCAAAPLKWLEAATFAADAAQPAIDLSGEPGLRLTAEGDGEGTRLRLHLHHACCDGGGALALLADLLAAYANLHAGRAATDSLPLRDPQLLPQRFSFPLRGEGWRRRGYDVFFGAREAVKFALRKPASLAAPGGGGELPSGGQAAAVNSVARRLSREQTAALRRAAAAAGATVNELAIRAAFLAADGWNAARGGDDPRSLLRLLVPCDLRTAQHAALPAANVMAYSFYTRRAADCRDPQALLAGVIGESAFIRDQNASMYFVRCLQVASRLPGGVRLMSSAEGCYATLLLSNAGASWRMPPAPLTRAGGRVVAGNLTVLDVRGYSPLRPGTRAGIVLTTYDQQLGLGLRFDPRHWNQSAAEAFLADLIGRLVA